MMNSREPSTLVVIYVDELLSSPGFADRRKLLDILRRVVSVLCLGWKPD